MSERCCKKCAHWELRPPYTTYRCLLFFAHTEADDTCDHYEAEAPFADDQVGSDAELDALVRGVSNE